MHLKSRYFVFILLIFGLVLFLTGCTLLEKRQSTGAIAGYIYVPVGLKNKENSNNYNLSSFDSPIPPDGYQPLENASIRITGSKKVVYTNSNGYFKIDNVNSGNQTVKISKEGYKRINIEVEIKKDKTVKISNSNEITLTKTKEWTFLVYLAGDNNLAKDLKENINEMEKVGSTDDINIIVKADFSDSYDNGPGGSYSYYIEKDNDFETITSEPIFNINEVDSGTSEEVSEFIDWASKLYPAKKYALILCDHGTGWKSPNKLQGVCWDYSVDSFINTLELKSIFEDSPVKFDLVGFDACLMGNTEVAYQIKDFASVMVASELTEPAGGWNYSTILSDLKENVKIDEKELGEIIVKRYYENFEGQEITMASIDLNQMSNLLTKIDALYYYINSNLDYNKIYEEAMKSLYITDLINNNYLDMKSILKSIEAAYDDNSLDNKVAEALMAYEQALLKYKGVNSLNGLSIQISTDFIGEEIKYSELDFTKDSKWDEFLINYWKNTNSIKGKVVIDNKIPKKNIRVSFYNFDIPSYINYSINDIITDKNGEFMIPALYYKPGDKISLEINTTDNFSLEDIKEKNLLFYQKGEMTTKLGNINLPVFDLYDYGLNLLSPLDKEKVTLPYKVEIAPYKNSNTDNLSYGLYFYNDRNDSFIGISNWYDDNIFKFNGELNGYNLSDNVYWNAAISYKLEEISFHSVKLGNYIFLESE